MFTTISNFYKRSSPSAHSSTNVHQDNELKRKKLSIFLAITVGYGFYYVCRLSFNVAKKSLADEGIFTVTEIGLIGSALFFAYAFGKLANGLLADRVNVRKFMTTGLLVSAVVNIILGSTTEFWFFAILWGINGWFQSFGAPSSVVSIVQWFGGKERGSIWGMWGTSHNIGEAITFILTAFVVGSFGWMWGFRTAGISCLIICFFMWKCLYERPEVYGLPKPEESASPKQNISMGAKQWQVFKSPAIWILAFSSSFFYVTRYAVNSWGLFFLEAEKGYSTLEAGSIISVNAIAGILGTFFSGILSDKYFKGRRNFPALIFGFIYFLSISLFVLGPANSVIDTFSMVMFGLSLGVLIIYLGGLMAVDVASKETSGTALGIVGVASYVGAGIQDIVSGILIDDSVTMIKGEVVYNFETVGYFWIGASLFSMLLATLVWNVKPHHN
ncbi:MFS transporter [uncultured Paraglaciecola sp.]|uniref:MFS transporter n=1 Tax=uncultured Paraglaciecola sp. TaxID=1765024 RepID=UPI0026065A6B|nr:MFS transporter [uncultured Paraglaciecola sp.]